MPGEFVMDVGPDGRGTVVLNGRDVSEEVRGVHTFAVAGEPTTVVLQLREGVDLKLSGEGVIEVEPGDVRGVMCELLDAVNPNVLEAAALEAMEWDSEDNPSFTTVLIQQLKEVINGADLN